jgi:hypothetical protein
VIGPMTRAAAMNRNSSHVRLRDSDWTLGLWAHARDCVDGVEGGTDAANRREQFAAVGQHW